MLNLKNILKASSVYTVLGFLPTASRIFLLPVFLIYLSPEDFALIGLNTLIASMLPLAMTLGLENAMARFYFDYSRNPALLKSYLSTVLLFVMMTSAVVAGLLIPFGDVLFGAIFKTNRFSFYPYGITAILSAFFSSLCSVIFVYYRNKQDIQNYTLFSGGLFLFSTIAESLAIIVFKSGPEGVIWTKLIVTGVITLFYTLRLLHQNGIYFERRFLPPSYQYSLPLVPYVFFGLIFTSFDRILIENRLDLTALAVYNLAMAIAHITEAFMYAIQSATYPLVYKMLKEGLDKNAREVNQIYRFMGIVALFIITGIIAATPIGILFFLNPKYILAISLIPIILISYGFRYLHIVYSEPLFFFKQTRKLPALAAIGGITSIIGNLILLPFFGIAGAAMAFVIAKGVQLIPTYYWYLKASALRFKLTYIIPVMGLIFITGLFLFLYFDVLIGHPLALCILYCVPLAILIIYLYGVFLAHNRYRPSIPSLAKLKEHL